MRNIFDRESYIPKDAVKVDTGDLNCEVYTYESNNSPHALAFSGKKQKPNFHYRYRSVESRDEAISKFVDSVKANKERKEKERAEKKSFRTTLKKDDILSSSWGYDQTNVDFYQVVEVLKSGKSVRIRSISGNYDETGFMSGTTMPIKDSFTSDVMTKRVSPSEYVKVNYVSYASKWDGTPMYESHYA